MQEDHAKKQLQKIYKYQNDYIKNNYDRISITLPTGSKQKINTAGETINGLFNKLFLEWMHQQDNKKQ